MTGIRHKKLEGELFDECASWIWEQLQEDGLFLSGEVIDLVLSTERELDIHTRDLAEIAQLLEDEFRMRGISTNPFAMEAPLIRSVLEWEDEFLGYAGIKRAES
jgi:hypothetical protein